MPSTAGISPLNWLEARRSSCKLERLPNSASISPLNQLPERFRVSKLERLPNSVGSPPLNWLSSRTKPVTRPLSSVVTPYHSPSGSSLSHFVLSVQFAPPVALKSATKVGRSWDCPSIEVDAQNGIPRLERSFTLANCRPLGIHPLNLLPCRFITSRLDRLTNSGGISPLNWLSERYSLLRLDRVPSSAGISPLNRLPDRASDSRLDRLPNSVGISPFNRLS